MTDFLIQFLVRDYSKINHPLVRERYGKMAAGVGIATNISLFALKIIMGLWVG